MFKNIDEYLHELKKELKGSDPALVQDALFDAEEHFRNALEESEERTPGIAEGDALLPLVEKYGMPFEVASAYKEIESRIQPTLASPKKQAVRSPGATFFGAVVDVRAWGAFLYLLLSGLTGCIYGMWIFMGVSVSFISLILIIGLPLTGLFLLSIRGIALVEGRIIEELLGFRMPRKPLFVQKDLSWSERFKALIIESHTWKALAYMILHFPLGLIYFSGIATLFAFSLKLFLYPMWYWALGRPLLDTSPPIYPPVWSVPLISIAGILMLPAVLHLAKLMGKIQGRFAKFMLVRNPQENSHA